ncbi:hypothetical protein [Natronosalvus caseinilyticus]|uniref:hypothetical protein n=1 Tax=Natronosalvus caseinilyticus TaxID=2953747 RepID=UPI0028A645CE|nr:hypothetical protein [Natronosalvus caseinilyticus]
MSEALEAIRERLSALERENDHLADRVERLETDLEEAHETIASLETQTDRLQTTNAALETEVEELSERLNIHNKDLTRVDALTEATRKRTGANKVRLEELQERELEKGAHLRTETVDEHALEIQGGHLERITKDDGQTYFRVPESADPLDSGSVSLAYGDLLPIQQLARMDEDMRRSTAKALPTRLATKLWQTRVDSSVGDNPWEPGRKEIREYVKASDLKHWIRRQEPGTSETYAKKLVSRTIDSILELSNHRVAVRKRTERKNGLEYIERRLIIPADVEIPGETTTPAPETAGVLG